MDPKLLEDLKLQNDATLHLCDAVLGHTSFVPYTLNTSCKVHRLPDSQLWQVQVGLLNVGCCPLWDEALEGDAIVCDLACDLRTAKHSVKVGNAITSERDFMVREHQQQSSLLEQPTSANLLTPYLSLELRLSLKSFNSHLAALMLHLVRQSLQQGALSCPWRSQEECHAAWLDGSADVVQQDKSGLASLDADEANERL